MSICLSIYVAFNGVRIKSQSLDLHAEIKH